MESIRNHIEIADHRAGFSDFYKYADILQQRLGIIFSSKVDDFDSLYWVFEFRECLFVLRYNVFLGISIYPDKDRENPKLNDLLTELKKRIADLNIDEGIIRSSK